ncbi:LacI family transcriptional regulator [Aquimarina sp. ERC-38]|uniref:LacI family DNA-binding transcriptional regulator n=1 Tax=Aquimarina sp. ERC-38 TaxID=2949996 RepID=UPI002247E674|nr:LacI family DNA-binding transcriptional regulator [Aquimarina sp. ERC-38]UZO79581.1 LacI family transcriptional regulator [Aquimarina sp. ERC-38]
MNEKKPATLKILAQELNLSISTVSRALANHPDISAETKKRVNQLALDLDYAPNIFARGLKSRRSYILGVIVPNISHLFTSTILKGILDEAENQGYKVIVSDSKYSEVKQNEMLQTMMQFGVDGILLSLARKTIAIDPILKLAKRLPLVLFDKVSDKVPCTQIVINEEEAAFNAVDHLIQTGKKKIAIIKETENSFNSEMRYAGYLRALRENNIELDQKLVISTEDISIINGKRSANLLLSLKNRPDGIFAITDGAAIGVIQALHKYKIKIPDEISVVGFSNSMHATIITPALTTVDQPGQKIGRTAVKFLIEEINTTATSLTTRTVEIKTNLIVRESTLRI